MACSNCGSTDHNIQRCPTVRCCGHCNRPGHDRRNCPKLHPPRVEAPRPRPTSPAPTPIASPLSSELLTRLRELCQEPDLLAHLYWPANHHHFERSRDAHLRGGPWRLVATPYHGVARPSKATVNLFAVDGAWLDNYAIAAETRSLHHGLLIRCTGLEAFIHREGYELHRVAAYHPAVDGVRDHHEFWRYDLGNHRGKAVDALRFARVVRLATPHAEEARIIDVPHGAVVACW